jgi:hypothetical protein
MMADLKPDGLPPADKLAWNAMDTGSRSPCDRWSVENIGYNRR